VNVCSHTHTAELVWFLNRANRQAGQTCAESGRPVSFQTVFADCGRIAGVFFLFKKFSSGALKCLLGSDFHGQMLFVCVCVCV